MKKITILGIGKSGVAAAILATQNGFEPFVSDVADRSVLEPHIAKLDTAQIKYECGGHSDRIYDAELVVLSPGIKKELPVVQAFFAKTISVISEIEFASRFTTQPLITITGSNGKTSTTTLLGRMLETAFSGSRMAGNIGIPLSDVVNKDDKHPVAVELSSFQLETIETLLPLATIWLNVSPNHLDWYNEYSDYIAAKALINKHNSAETVVIYNADDAIVKEHSEAAEGVKKSFSLTSKSADAFVTDQAIMLQYSKGEIELVKLAELQFSGPHHVMNMMAASLAAQVAGVELPIIRFVLKAFNGLEHRMEVVKTIHGVTFINDSKSTSIEALKMALLSFDQKIILIAGGKHKGASYSPLAALISERTKQVLLIGAAAPIMNADWQDHSTIQITENLAASVREAARLAKSGDVVLFSPACSSFDQFANYEERGLEFKRLVSEL